MLGNELALVRKWKFPGDRKLFDSCRRFFGSPDIEESFEGMGVLELLKDRIDWGDTAGDIIRRKLIGLEGVRHWSRS